MIILICLMFLSLSCVSASDEGIVLANADLNNVDDEILYVLADSENDDLKNSESIGLADAGNDYLADTVYDELVADESNDLNDSDVDGDNSLNGTDVELNQSDIANFTELNDLIDSSDSILNLTMDYQAIDDSESLTIDESISIYGNNHTLDCKNALIIFDSNDSEFVFENITFKDYHFTAGDVENISVTFNDCIFEFMDYSEDITSVQEEWIPSTTGPIDAKIKKLALSIIGKSQNLTACKKLAVWVGKNIDHETKAGFYQSPLTTLNRKKGNCCCQSNLFLQMCEAVGLTKLYNFYFVHVGQAKFGQRHFFVIVDDILVDVDAKPDNPWGHASIGNRGVYRVTQYPYLPLPREY